MRDPAPEGFTVRTPFAVVDVSADTPDVRARLALLLAGYPAAPPGAMPDRRYAVVLAGDEPGLWRDGERWDETADADELIPQIEGDLYRLAMHGAKAADAMPLHAAAVVLAGRAWLIAGPSGAGKSTLALGLLHADPTACYITDDLLFVDRSGQVAGMPRAIGFIARPAAIPDAPADGLTPFDASWTTHDGHRVSTPSVAIDEGRSSVDWHNPAGVIFPRHDALAPAARVRSLPSGDAVRRLWRLAWNSGPAHFDRLCRLMRHLPARELLASDVSSAVAAVARMTAPA